MIRKRSNCTLAELYAWLTGKATSCVAQVRRRVRDCAIYIKDRRSPTDPDSSHKHQCQTDGCGFMWQHSDDCAGDHAAHTCPLCNKIQMSRYYGPLEPDYIGNTRPQPKVD